MPRKPKNVEQLETVDNVCEPEVARPAEGPLEQSGSDPAATAPVLDSGRRGPHTAAEGSGAGMMDAASAVAGAEKEPLGEEWTGSPRDNGIGDEVWDVGAEQMGTDAELSEDIEDGNEISEDDEEAELLLPSESTAGQEVELSPEEVVRRAQVREAARRLGIQQLYPEQERAIAAAMQGQDALVVLPTGFGKSACYQIPSMILPHPVVLVSPLLALLRDQHEKLLARKIPVERIDGTVRGRARKEALDRIAVGKALLVMTTPETLSSEELGEVLLRCGISLAAVDEAHCISEWGHDFRPAYMRLGERLHELGSPPVLALTATATQAVRDDIIRYLGMRSPVVVASSPHRANLAFEVVHATGNERLRALVRFIKRLRRPGIVYCATTKEVDRLYGALTRMRLPVHRYHGRMAGKDRNREQELFMRKGRRTIMVATSAFGLGIDKPDIRYIVHYQAPASLEQYVQEAGRAGRDGRRANCILLFDAKDREVHETLQQASRIRPDQLYRISTALAAYAAEGRQPDMEALTLAAQLNERQAKALLVVLEEAGLVQLEEDQVRIVVPADEFEEQARALAGRFVTLRTQDGRRLDRIAEYAYSKECRAVFLRRYFGEEDGTRCGLCDVCRGAAERPVTFYQPIARREPPKKKKRKRRRRKSKQHRTVTTASVASATPIGVAEEPLADLAADPAPLPLGPEEA